MLRDLEALKNEMQGGGCDPDCGCEDGACAADSFLPAYKPDDFKRNVTILNQALENFGFAIATLARLTEEAYLLQDEAF